MSKIVYEREQLGRGDPSNPNHHRQYQSWNALIASPGMFTVDFSFPDSSLQRNHDSAVGEAVITVPAPLRGGGDLIQLPTTLRPILLHYRPNLLPSGRRK
jgi:hypothetical protein